MASQFVLFPLVLQCGVWKSGVEILRVASLPQDDRKGNIQSVGEGLDPPISFDMFSSNGGRVKTRPYNETPQACM